MSFIKDIEQQSLTIEALYPDINTPVYQDLIEFYNDFKSDEAVLYAYTSGSTGIPKKIAIDKKYMMESAIMTLSFLKIPSGVTTLLGMPLRFIGAKMVVVRALVGSLKLVVTEPSSHPLEGLDKAPYFAAMTPHQVASSLDNEHDYELLRKIKVLIIGGGPVNSDLLQRIKDFENEIYSTYGMTETLSHIALKKLNRVSKSSYVPFEGVVLEKTESGTLKISCSRIGVSDLKTNDLVSFNADGSFDIEGRLDNVINSGGIKIQIEKLECKIQEFIKTPFNVSFVPDDLLGQKCVLISTYEISENLQEKIHSALPKYEAPKVYLKAEKLPVTLSGKPDRKALAALALDLYKNN